MVSRYSAALLIALIGACDDSYRAARRDTVTGRESPVPLEQLAEAKPAAHSEPIVLDRLTIRDSMEWECGGNGGRVGTLYADGVFVDSVDLYLRVHSLPGGILFAPVRSSELPDLGIETCPEGPVLFDGLNRRPLKEFLPFFSEHFSSPTVIDSMIWYWGFIGDRLYAVKYEVRTDRADTVFLAEDQLLQATDNRYQFQSPERTNSHVRYATYRRTFTLATDMRVVHDSIDP
jgi:hypothetical protein